MEFIVSVMMVLIIFLFGLMVFQDRTDFNSTKFINWDSDVVATRIARNINNVYLSDENTVVLDYISWVGKNRSVSFTEKAVNVWNEFGYIDAPILAKINNQVIDFNGPIIFEKTKGIVVVRYPDE
ncbi:MAG: hypothetical protein GX950_01395 [Candidatus Diapherotrites archaeon]|uniref:Uncharacterized protein n=1 Tax=Candidatus Iainarchaeum sp. TaxID=3101447 RepID=A0A7K4BYW1_9ARCH|nr:hypothetical protein [Candidatus Diapherotrites archaeon]